MKPSNFYLVNNPSKMLIDQILSISNYLIQIDLFSTKQWKAEVNKWLEFAQQKGQLDIKRLDNQAQGIRKSHLTEIKTAYHIEQILGYKISDFNRTTHGGKDVDFVIDVDEQGIYSELKGPTWHGELTEQEKRSDRKKDVKYKSGEVRCVAPWQQIRYAVKKANDKYLPECKNLLIVNGDLFVPILDDESDININKALFDDIGLMKDFYPDEEENQIEKGYFTSNQFMKIGGLLLLNCLLIDTQFIYRHKFIPNPYAKNKFIFNKQPIT